MQPIYLRMEQQIYDSEFMDIINSEKDVFQMNKNLEPFRNEFQEIVANTLDYELIFDQVDCRKKLQEYVKVQLAVKPHLYELIEIKDHAVHFYQPFQET